MVPALTTGASARRATSGSTVDSLSVKKAARMEDGVLDLIAVHVSTGLLVLSVKEITEQVLVSHKLITRCVKAS